MKQNKRTIKFKGHFIIPIGDNYKVLPPRPLNYSNKLTTFWDLLFTHTSIAKREINRHLKSKNVNLSDENLVLTNNEIFGRQITPALKARFPQPVLFPHKNKTKLARAQSFAVTAWLNCNLSDCLYYLEQAECHEFPFGTNTTQCLINQLLEHKSN